MTTVALLLVLGFIACTLRVETYTNCTVCCGGEIAPVCTCTVPGPPSLWLTLTLVSDLGPCCDLVALSPIELKWENYGPNSEWTSDALCGGRIRIQYTNAFCRFITYCDDVASATGLINAGTMECDPLYFTVDAIHWGFGDCCADTFSGVITE